MREIQITQILIVSITISYIFCTLVHLFSFSVIQISNFNNPKAIEEGFKSDWRNILQTLRDF